MSLSMSDAARFLALELRVAELENEIVECAYATRVAEIEKQIAELAKRSHSQLVEAVVEPPRRGRPPKTLEERMRAQEHDPIDAE